MALSMFTYKTTKEKICKNNLSYSDMRAIWQGHKIKAYERRLGPTDGSDIKVVVKTDKVAEAKSMVSELREGLGASEARQVPLAEKEHGSQDASPLGHV